MAFKDDPKPLRSRKAHQGVKVSVNMRATVSGSFRKAMTDVQDAVYELTDLGVTILSPADPRVVDSFGQFLFVASDRLRNILLVQQRHLAAIEASDFLWLVAPDGYVGSSASMEVGFAVAKGIPILGTEPPEDWTLRRYVNLVHTPSEAVERFERSRTRRASADALIDPSSAVDWAHAELEAVRAALLAPSDPTDEVNLHRAADNIRRVVQSF